MSSIQERDETVRFTFLNQEVTARNLPLINGNLLNLSEQQVKEIEQTIQATFPYSPGLTTVIYVPLDKQEITSINSFQVLKYPISAADAIPSNRAIAKIGAVWIYWKLLGEALRSGRFDFYHFLSFNIFPIYLDHNDNPIVKISPIEKGNTLYGESPYVQYLPMINYAGDSDFVGIDNPQNSVPVRLINNNYVEIPDQDIGVTAEVAKKVFDTARKVHILEEEEVTGLIKSSYGSFPITIKQMIDHTLKYENFLNGYNMVRAYYLHAQNPVDSIVYEVINYLSQFTKTEFSKPEHLLTSPTATAVDNLVDSLEEMYQQALPLYKFS